MRISFDPHVRFNTKLNLFFEKQKFSHLSISKQGTIIMYKYSFIVLKLGNKILIRKKKRGDYMKKGLMRIFSTKMLCNIYLELLF